MTVAEEPAGGPVVWQGRRPDDRGRAFGNRARAHLFRSWPGRGESWADGVDEDLAVCELGGEGGREGILGGLSARDVAGLTELGRGLVGLGGIAGAY